MYNFLLPSGICDNGFLYNGRVFNDGQDFDWVRGVQSTCGRQVWISFQVGYKVNQIDHTLGPSQVTQQQLTSTVINGGVHTKKQ